MGLAVRDLYKSYDGRPVVNGVSFDVVPGEVIGLLGPNGAGKTTAFYMVIGLIKPDKGAVYFNGEDISSLPMHERARRGIGYLPQEPSVFKDLSVEENMFSVLEFLGLDGSAMQKQSDSLMQELGIFSLAKKKAGALSGGERRRLEIARSLAVSPKCLMLDEPFANIDPIAISDVKSMISHLKKRGISILITDHNAREIISIVDKSYLIADGKVIFSGSVETLLQHEESKRRYFGSDFTL
ncbi:MAG: LPS export ABC transporter ATP-binding protein [Chlamydia sp.]